MVTAACLTGNVDIDDEGFIFLKRTKHHVYYLHDEPNAVVYIIAVWCAPKAGVPLLIDRHAQNSSTGATWTRSYEWNVPALCAVPFRQFMSRCCSQTGDSDRVCLAA